MTLLDAGANPDVKETRWAESLLDIADMKFIPALLDAGAGARARESASPDPQAVIRAAGHGNLTTVIAQFSVGTDPNAQDAHGFTPLHYAALNLKTRVVAWLLANGANPDASDNSANLTPLELLNVRLSNRADRARFFAGAGGGVGIFAGLLSSLGLAKERKEAEAIIALLREGRENWTWLDTLRYKLK